MGVGDTQPVHPPQQWSKVEQKNNTHPVKRTDHFSLEGRFSDTMHVKMNHSGRVGTQVGKGT